MKSLWVALLLLCSGCLTVELAPPMASYGLLPGTTVVYHAENEHAAGVETEFTFHFDGATVYDLYANPVAGWEVTVSNDEGFSFPMRWYYRENADREPTTLAWAFDGCGQPLARTKDGVTIWGTAFEGVPPIVAATRAEPAHDLELVIGEEMWTIDNRAQPPATIIEGPPDAVSITHARGAVTPGSGQAPVCDTGPRPAPTLLNMTTHWSGFEPGLEPPLAAALTAAKSSPTARNAASFFQTHPAATAQRLWHDPDGGTNGAGAWHILWSDGASDVLVSTCARDGVPVAGVLDDLICTDRTTAWGKPRIAPVAFDIVEPSEIIAKALAIKGATACDLFWHWTDEEVPRWEMFACTAPRSGDIVAEAATPWLRIDASAGELIYRWE